MVGSNKQFFTVHFYFFTSCTKMNPRRLINASSILSRSNVFLGSVSAWHTRILCDTLSSVRWMDLDWSEKKGWIDFLLDHLDSTWIGRKDGGYVFQGSGFAWERGKRNPICDYVSVYVDSNAEFVGWGWALVGGSGMDGHIESVHC